MKFRNLLLLALALGTVAPAAVFADDYVDDIYFNPKKDTHVGAKKKNPNYIENFSDIDVDTYNLRGQYYTTPIDTIGSKIGSEEDFVYTQQIQKYYNPTIVLDNSQLLADVLQNSYGNVEIVYNGITPAFLPSYRYGWPYYSYYDPWYWNVGFGGWYDPWYWGPSWSWNWGPSWGWGPSWSWGWGPSWSWGWGGPGWGPGPVGPALGWNRPNATWSPGGNRPVNPGVGWAGNNRPGNSRPASTSRPSNSHSGSQWGISGPNYSGGNNSSSQNRGYVIGNNGNRYRQSGNTNTGNRVNSGTTNTNSNRNYNTNSTNSNRNNNSYNSNRNSNYTRNSGSYNTGRSSGNGSFGSGSFGGSRSSGGGSSRGGRR